MFFICGIHLNLTNTAPQWRTYTKTCHVITPDISPILLFTFFQQIYYLDADIQFLDSKGKMKRFVGIAENVGDAFTFWI